MRKAVAFSKLSLVFRKASDVSEELVISLLITVSPRIAPYLSEKVTLRVVSSES
jgi:hypothetical protein